MNELKHFLNSKSLKETISINGQSAYICTKLKLELEDISNKKYCQFKDIPGDRVLSIIENFFNLDNSFKLENLFPDCLSWSLNGENEQSIKNNIEQALTSKNISDFYKEKIIHCLDELISNSLCAANPELKGSKDLRKERAIKDIDVKVYLGSDYYVILIRDHYGMFDTNSQLKAFGQDLFAQAPVNQKASAGAGVGLQIVRELCSLLVFRQKTNQWTETAAFFIKNCNSQSPLIFQDIK